MLSNMCQINPYAIAVLLVFMATVLTQFLYPLLTSVPFALFDLAVAITARFGGIAAGLLATLLFILSISYFFLPPINSIAISDPGDFAQLLLSAFAAVSICYLVSKPTAPYQSEQIKQKLSEQLIDCRLQESEEQLRLAMQAALIGIWNWNLITGEIAWTPEHEQLFGLVSGCFDGCYQTFEACVHPDDRAELQQIVQAAIREHQIYKHEYRVIWPDGSVHWVEGRGQTFYDETGTPVRMTGTVMNIDDRKQAEETICRSEERYRSLVTAIFEIVWTADAAGTLTSISPAWFDLTGQSWNELQQRGWLDYLHPDDRNRAIQAWTNAVANRTSYTIEYRIQAKDGTYRDFRVRGVPVKHCDSSIWEWVGTLNDITERKRSDINLAKAKLELEQRVAERTIELTVANNRLLQAFLELQRSKQEVEDLYNRAPCGYHSLDTHGIFVRINDTELNWLGYTREQVLHKLKFVDLLTPDSKNIFHEHFPKFRQQGWVNNLEFQLCNKDGSTRWVSLSATAIYDQAGRFIMSRSTVFDISERKRIEAERNQAELALRESEARYRQIVEIANEGIWEINADGYTTFVNPKMADLLGYRVEEMLGKSLFELMDEESRAIAEANLERRRQGIVEQHDFKFQRRDGSALWTIVSTTPIVNSAGEFSALAMVTHISDRKQAEMALQKSEQKFRAIFEQTFQLIALLAPDGTLLEVNQAPLDFAQMKREEILQRPLWEVPALATSVVTQEIAKTAIAQAAAGEFYRSEVTVPGADGNYTTFDFSVKPVLNEAGEVSLLIAEGRDISALKQAEESLAKELMQSKALFKASFDGIVVLDQQGNVVDASESFAQMLGYSLEETLHLHVADWDAQWSKEELAKIIQNSMFVHTPFETLHRRKDGSLYEVEISVSDVKLEDRVLQLCICRDITKRKQTEATLAQLASIVESSDEAIFSKTLEGTVLSWNASAERLFGYSSEEMIGCSITQIIPANQLEKEAWILEQLKRGEHIHHYETVRQCKDGTLIDIAVTISPIKDAEGKIIGAAQIAHDITEQRAVEQMKAEFISIVSHELRTPLTSINGALELLSTGLIQPDSARGQETLQIAAAESDRLTRLVNDILDLERLESGKIRIERRPWNLGELMYRAIDFMQLAANQAAITLLVEPVSIVLQIDGDRILQVLTNLLSNAIKFSPNHSTIWLTAKIDAAQEDKPDTAASTPHVLITVCDQGRGIPAHKLERIFERFQQVDASDSRKKGGTGLGLAICRSIVQQHGGNIWVESIVEQGSSFHFTLPLITDE